MSGRRKLLTDKERRKIAKQSEGIETLPLFELEAAEPQNAGSKK